jgi:hypothetical protein
MAGLSRARLNAHGTHPHCFSPLSPLWLFAKSLKRELKQKQERKTESDSTLATEAGGARRRRDPAVAGHGGGEAGAGGVVALVVLVAGCG